VIWSIYRLASTGHFATSLVIVFVLRMAKRSLSTFANGTVENSDESVAFSQAVGMVSRPLVETGHTIRIWTLEFYWLMGWEI
jgi:hypothetical protein